MLLRLVDDPPHGGRRGRPRGLPLLLPLLSVLLRALLLLIGQNPIIHARAEKNHHTSMHPSE